MRELYYGVTDQQRAAKHRWDDARALLHAGRWRGAMYLSGYAIECLLKTKLMQMFKCRNLTELEDELRRRGVLADESTIFTHRLQLLLRLAHGLERMQRNDAIWRLFGTVNRWIPAWRYSPDLSRKEDAEDFLEAVDAIIRWVESNT